MATATKKATEQAMAIEIQPITLNHMTLTVVGDSPLIMHKWSQKAKQEILGKQMKKASKGKEKKNPIRDYVQSMYWLDENGNEIEPPVVNDYETDEEAAKEYERIQKIAENSRFGFPACAFKAAALDAGFQQGAIAKKTTVKGGFHITQELVPIEGVPEMREDMVRVGGISKTADIRYRGSFKSWKATLDITYNPNSVSASQIANLLNLGGFANGIGEWRPSKNGENGRFHVLTD